MPDESAVVEPGQNQPLWITVRPSADAPAGTYCAQVKLQSGATTLVAGVEFEVFDFDLPATSFLRTDFGCWPVSRTVLKEAGFGGPPEDFSALCRDNYLAHRITPREKAMAWHDIEQMERMVEVYAARGMTTLHIPYRLVDQPRHLRTVADRLETLGWLHRAFVYRYDEATKETWPRLKEYADTLRKIHPRLRLLATVYANDPLPLYGAVSIWVRPLSDEPWIARRLEAGDEFWMVNLPQVESSVEGDLGGLRRVFWRLKALGFTGSLYWNCVGGYGNDNPWTDVSCSGANGLAHLLYPSPSGPVDTIRWETLADGIQDYDYLCMLEALIARCREQSAEQQGVAAAADLARSAKEWSLQDGADVPGLNRLRRDIATHIVLMNRLVSEPK